MENQDVDRTLGLLWRQQLGTPQGSRGPKQRVSVDQVVRTAIAVADEEGLPAFSMRKVADRLGLKLMSIYTYVPGRAELIGLMIDEVAGELELPPHEGSLRQRLTGVALQIWQEYHRHPWLLQVENSRPWIGPHVCDRYEWQLAAIEGAGFHRPGDGPGRHTCRQLRRRVGADIRRRPPHSPAVRDLRRRMVENQRTDSRARYAPWRLPDLRQGRAGRRPGVQRGGRP